MRYTLAMITAIALLCLTSSAFATPFSSTSTILPPDLTKAERFGSSMARDGQLLLIGASDYEDTKARQGRAHLYKQGPNQSWTLVHSFTPSVVENGACGFGVAIKDKRMAIACPGRDKKVYIYDEVSPDQWRLTQTVLPIDPNNAAEFGFKLQIKDNLLIIAGLRQVYTYDMGPPNTMKQPSPAPSVLQISGDSIVNLDMSGDWMTVQHLDFTTNPSGKTIVDLYRFNNNTANPVTSLSTEGPTLSCVTQTNNNNVVRVGIYNKKEVMNPATGAIDSEISTTLYQIDANNANQLTILGKIQTTKPMPPFDLFLSDMKILGDDIFISDQDNNTLQQLQYDAVRGALLSLHVFDAPSIASQEEFGSKILLSPDGLLVSSVNTRNVPGGRVFYKAVRLGPPLITFHPEFGKKIDENGVISGQAPANADLSITIGNTTQQFKANNKGLWRYPLNAFGVLSGPTDATIKLISPAYDLQLSMIVETKHSPLQITNLNHQQSTNLPNNTISGECKDDGPLVISVESTNGDVKPYETNCINKMWSLTLPMDPSEGDGRLFVQEKFNLKDAISIAINIDKTPPTLNNLDFPMNPLQVTETKPSFDVTCQDNVACTKVQVKLGDAVPQEVTLNEMGEFKITVEKDLIPNMGFPIEVIAEDAAGNMTVKQFEVIFPEESITQPEITYPEDKTSYNEDGLTSFQFLLDPNQPTTITLNIITPGVTKTEVDQTTLMGASEWTNFQLDDDPQIYELIATTGDQDARVVFSAFEGIDEFTIGGQPILAETVVDVGASFEISGKSPCLDCEVKGYWVDVDNQLTDSGVETETDSDGNWTLSFVEEPAANNVRLVIQIEAKIGEDEYVLEDGELILNIGDGPICNTPPCDGMTPGTPPEKLDNALCAASPTKRPPALPMMLVLCIILGYVLSSKQNRE